MIIHLSEALSIQGKTRQYPLTLGFDTLKTFDGPCPIVSCEPLILSITCQEHKVLKLELPVKLKLQQRCARCLESVITDMDFTIECEADMKMSEKDRIDALDEQAFIQGYQLDTDELIRGELLMQLPVRVLCKADCKGICRKCGANLNHESCQCDTQELDPRMASILDIFKNAQE